MGNVRFRTLSDFTHHGANLLVECRACPHKSVVDANKAVRWFHCHCWNPALEVAVSHFRCVVCRGKADTIKPTPAKPDRPDWMAYESDWGKLVKRLRG